MKRIVFCLLSLFVLVMTTPAVADEAVSLKVGYLSMGASGQFSGNLNAAGTRVDVDQTLGFGRSNNVIAEAALQLGDSRLSFGYMPLQFDGSGVLNTALTFNGQNFTVGDTVTSRIKADVFDIAYTYYLINMDDMPSRLQLGAELSVKVVKAESSMQSLTSGVREAVSATLPIPTLGVRGRMALADFLGVSARIGYLGYAGNRFLDADAQLEFSPLPAMGVFGGYRYVDVKVDTSGVFLDARFSGPYVGGFYRF